MRGPARLADRADLLADLPIPPGQERATVNDHVHLVGAGRHRVRDVGQLDRQRGAPRRERGGHGRHQDRAAGQLTAGHGHQVRIYADGSDRRNRRVRRIRPAGLRAQPSDLARRIRALQRGQVDHADRRLQRPHLGVPLDRPGRQGRRPLLPRPPGQLRAIRAGPGEARHRRPRSRPRHTPDPAGAARTGTGPAFMPAFTGGRRDGPGLRSSPVTFPPFRPGPPRHSPRVRWRTPA